MSEAADLGALHQRAPVIPQLELTRGEIALWPVTPEDHQFLYWIATCEQNAYRWRFRGHVPSFEAFRESLSGGVLAQFVVHARELGRRVGHVVAYDADLSAGHVRVAAVMDPSFTYLGQGRDGLVAFASYLFDTWAFRYLYAEVPGYVVDLFRPSAGLNDMLPFEEVGRLPDFLFHKGTFHDMHIFGLSRERFAAVRETFG